MRSGPILSCTPGDGLGNRFLVIEKSELDSIELVMNEIAPQLCGEIYDGVLVTDRTSENLVDVKIWNRDGSSGGACLNGLRVVAKWLGGKSGTFLMNGRQMTWRRVGAEIELHLSGKDFPKDMELAMVVTSAGPGLSVPFWNPHCVVPVANVDDVDLSTVAASVRTAGIYFPDGANVEVVSEDGPGRVKMRVDERGIGETQACGSGAVAVALSAWGGGLEGPLTVVMPGGTLRLCRAEDGGVKLRGEAKIGSTESFPINLS